MHTIPLRPKFTMTLACPSTVVLQRLCDRLEAGPQVLRRTRTPGGGKSESVRERDFFVLTVPENEQRVWSPWLTIEVTPQDGGSHLFARFGPHPTVWTGFAFFYLILSVTFLFCLAFAAALVTTGSQPWSLGISAGALVLMVVMWWVSQVGQRLARDQMEALRSELLEAMKDCALTIEGWSPG